MLLQNETAQTRINALQREIDELRKQITPELPMIRRLRGRGRPPKSVTFDEQVNPSQKKTSKVRRRRARRQNRIARVAIAPGFVLTTRPGTIYTTVCKVLARLADSPNTMSCSKRLGTMSRRAQRTSSCSKSASHEQTLKERSEVIRIIWRIVSGGRRCIRRKRMLECAGFSAC